MNDIRKTKSVFSTLFQEWKYPIGTDTKWSWRTSLFIKIKRFNYFILFSPYYTIRNFKLESSNNRRFTTWELINPLKIKFMSRSSFNYCKKCNDESCCAIKDKYFERDILSRKIKYIKTVGTCENKLFSPYETYLGSGGEEGGFYFGSNATWTTNEKGGSLCL